MGNCRSRWNIWTQKGGVFVEKGFVKSRDMLNIEISCREEKSENHKNSKYTFSTFQKGKIIHFWKCFFNCQWIGNQQQHNKQYSVRQSEAAQQAINWIWVPYLSDTKRSKRWGSPKDWCYTKCSKSIDNTCMLTPNNSHTPFCRNSPQDLAFSTLVF